MPTAQGDEAGSPWDWSVIDGKGSVVKAEGFCTLYDEDCLTGVLGTNP